MAPIRSCASLPVPMLAFLALSVVLGALAVPHRPRYIDCIDSTECTAWECCVLGMGRYSIPKCVPLSDVGGSCRPETSAQPVNTTVSYPDGQQVQLSNVFMLMCPCVPGLACDRDRNVCHNPTDSFDFNTL